MNEGGCVGESHEAMKGGDLREGKDGCGDSISRVEVDEFVVAVVQGDEEHLSRYVFVLVVRKEEWKSRDI